MNTSALGVTKEMIGKYIKVSFDSSWKFRVFGRTFMDQMAVQILHIVDGSEIVVGSFYVMGENELEQWKSFARTGNIEFQDQRPDHKTS